MAKWIRAVRLSKTLVRCNSVVALNKDGYTVNPPQKKKKIR